MSNQNFLRDLPKKDFTPLHPDEIEPLLRQLWEYVGQQRMIAYVPWAHPAKRHQDTGRREAFDLVLMFIKGSVETSVDGKLLDIDHPDRVMAIYKAEGEI